MEAKDRERGQAAPEVVSSLGAAPLTPLISNKLSSSNSASPKFSTPLHTLSTCPHALLVFSGLVLLGLISSPFPKFPRSPTPPARVEEQVMHRFDQQRQRSGERERDAGPCDGDEARKGGRRGAQRTSEERRRPTADPPSRTIQLWQRMRAGNSSSRPFLPFSLDHLRQSSPSPRLTLHDRPLAAYRRGNDLDLEYSAFSRLSTSLKAPSPVFRERFIHCFFRLNS
jgi:hypothetical protein